MKKEAISVTNQLAGLEPASVFSYFEAICQIPHGSRDTKRISDYCAQFAQERGLRWRQDASNNVIIWKEGSADYKNHPPVIVQGHLDMVCEKEPDCAIDFSTDGLRLRTDGKTVEAEGTTLGGDDGIAVAYALALLDSHDIPHPPLEVVLTTDEEIGMLGAAAIDLSDLKGRLLLNIDSEDEGVLTVSCAGGATSTLTLPVARREMEGQLVTVELTGLQGGHSGVEIHKGRANACKQMGKLLAEMAERADFALATIDGGQKDNAIPRSCTATLLTSDLATLREAFDEAKKDLLAQLLPMEPAAQLSMTEGGAVRRAVFNRNSTVGLLQAVPNGVQAMSREIPGLVQTSLNLGILATREDAVTLTFSVRSSVNAEKTELIGRLRQFSEKFGAAYSQMGEYPAWEYRQDSRLRPIMVETFEQLYGRKPVVEAIHAGLECGILADKLPGLDAVSFGPDMKDIHTTRETLDVASVRRTWDYLCAVLARL